MITLSHPTGNVCVRHALAALGREGLLHSFYTTFAWNNNWSPFLPARVRPAFERRSYPIAWEKIKTQPFGELARLAHLPFAPSIDDIYFDLDKRVAKELNAHYSHPLTPAAARARPTAVYAYEDGAAQTFFAAKKLGIRTFYELPIGHTSAARKIFQEEALLKPEWAATLTGLDDPPQKLARKNQELALADHVIVASSFTASTLAGLLRQNQPLSIIPYGAPEQKTFAPRPAAGKLKVLYAGSLTQRKGLSYLFEAAGKLSPYIELTLMGRPAAPCAALEKELKKYRHYPSLPHADVLELMRAQDILVLPSLFEGFGLVLAEALSCGLPIISTANTAAPDLIAEGREGFIIPLRTPDAIVEKLSWAISRRAELSAMQKAAYDRAKTLGWPDYEQKLINLIKDSLQTL